MSTSSHIYPTLTGTISPEHMATEPAPGALGAEWYAPSSYVYQDPYITPYPSSTVESQPWSSYTRASVPDLPLGYAMHHPQPQQQLPQPMKDPGRPRSSPSTFGPSADSITWTTTGLGIQYTSTTDQPTPVTSTFPPNVFQAYSEDHYSASPPEIRQPQPRRPYASIAPSPSGIVAKRKREDSEKPEGHFPTEKRRKRTASVVSADLSEDDRFLVQLKEDESLPWKEIATRFQTDKGKSFQVAALQMRYKRLREKFRIWEDQDLTALKLAHEYWEKYKWDIISAKMIDFGLQDRWPARHCSRKWQELDVATIQPVSTATGMTPASVSQFSSPVDKPIHFAFMPIQ